MRQAMAQIDDPGGKRVPGLGDCAVEVIDPDALVGACALAWLVEHARAAVQAATGRPGEVRVRVVGDIAMAAAHARYAGVEGTTDVLTFDLAEGSGAAGEGLDVDMLVCVDEARRQATARGHAMERELLLYILHGVLHCLGHDDHDDAAFERMHAEEDRVLEAIGVGKTFARTANERAGGGA